MTKTQKNDRNEKKKAFFKCCLFGCVYVCSSVCAMCQSGCSACVGGCVCGCVWVWICGMLVWVSACVCVCVQGLGVHSTVCINTHQHRRVFDFFFVHFRIVERHFTHPANFDANSRPKRVPVLGVKDEKESNFGYTAGKKLLRLQFSSLT